MENYTETLITPKTPKTPKNGFRVTAKNLFITIKGHIDMSYIHFIHNKFPIQTWFYCHETGKTRTYPHSHIMLKLFNKANITDPRSLDFNDVHPDIQALKNWEQSICYGTKEGTFFTNIPESVFKKILNKNKSAGGNGFKQVINNIVNSKNTIEAFENNATDFKDIVAIERIFANKNLIIDKELVDKYLNSTYLDWQSTIANWLSQPPSDRTVHWIVDKIGGNGKSFFSRKFRFEHQDNCLIIGSTGKPSDIADVIRNWMTQGNIPKYIFIDLPRSCEYKDNIYTSIESIKNGMITCTKYKGQTLEFSSPHVIIFSNWYPSIKKLSKDRWNIHCLDNKILKHMTLEDMKCIDPFA